MHDRGRVSGRADGGVVVRIKSKTIACLGIGAGGDQEINGAVVYQPRRAGYVAHQIVVLRKIIDCDGVVVRVFLLGITGLEWASVIEGWDINVGPAKIIPQKCAMAGRPPGGVWAELNAAVPLKQVERRMGSVKIKVVDHPCQIILVIISGGIVVGNHVACRPPFQHHRYVEPVEDVVFHQARTGFVGQHQGVIRATRSVAKTIVKITVPYFTAETPVNANLISIGEIAFHIF